MRPIVLDTPQGIAANKSVDDAQTKQRGGVNDLLEMLDDRAPMTHIRIERIGIIPKAGKRDAMLAAEVLNSPCLVTAKLIHIYMANSRVTPIRPARWPTHGLDASESLICGKC